MRMEFSDSPPIMLSNQSNHGTFQLVMILKFILRAGLDPEITLSYPICMDYGEGGRQYFWMTCSHKQDDELFKIV